MKFQKIIYWSASVLFSVWMLANAYAYLTSEQVRVLCNHLGFPGYFRIELAIAKIIGVVVLLLPMIKARWKEWAYAGFTITMISGFIAHLASGDALLSASSAIAAMVILLTSYITYSNLKNSKQ